MAKTALTLLNEMPYARFDLSLYACEIQNEEYMLCDIAFAFI